MMNAKNLVSEFLWDSAFPMPDCMSYFLVPYRENAGVNITDSA